MVGSLPVNVGGVGSGPGPGGSHVPWSGWVHVPQVLSLGSGACEPQLLSLRAAAAEARVPGARAPQWGGAAVLRGLRGTAEGDPRSPQLEKSPHAAMKIQLSQK